MNGRILSSIPIAAATCAVLSLLRLQSHKNHGAFLFMRLCLSAVIIACTITVSALAQGPRQQLTPEETKALIEKRESIEKQLEDIAIIDRKVMVPMKDGARMAADIYRP